MLKFNNAAVRTVALCFEMDSIKQGYKIPILNKSNQKRHTNVGI